MLRDLDLLKQIAEVTDVSACLSVPTLDEKAWRATEPHTPNPRARLEAVAELNRAGIPTGILIAPLMPGINDAPEQVAKIVELATEAGATSIGGQTLFLRGSVAQGVLRLAARAPARPAAALRGALPPRRVPARRPSAARSSAPPARRGLRSGDRQRWKHRVIERRRSLEREARERAAEAAAQPTRGERMPRSALF